MSGNRAATIGRLLLVLCGALAAFVPAQRTERSPEGATTRPKPAPPADFSSEGMTRRVAELLPVLEEVSGLKANGPIVVRAATREELGAVILEETIIFRDSFEGIGRGALLRMVLRAQTNILGQLAFAKVELSTGDVLVVAENFRERARDPALGARVLTQEVLDSLLLHEAAHVLHHRHDPLPGFFGAPRSMSELGLKNLVVEGLADYFARVACARLGLTEAFEFRRKAQGTLPPDLAATLSPRDRAYYAASTMAPYVEGEAFVAALVERVGLKEAIDRLLRSPPLSMHEAQDLDVYLQDGAPVVDDVALAAALRVLPQRPKFELGDAGFSRDALAALFFEIGEEAAAAS
jgi:hypothetical protein